jgi:hypothetical protein
MKKLALVLAVIFGLSTPAHAVELVVNYPSTAVLVQLAQALGYYNAAQSQVVIAGGLAANGDYFINVVGAVVQTPAVYDTATPPNLITPAVMAPGLWLRIRHNADPAIITTKMKPTFLALAASLGATIYMQYPIGPNDVNGNPTLAWSSDGVTIAPAWVGSIGQIM